MINWSDPKYPISKYLTVHDALYLHSWGVLHIPTEIEIQNILTLALIIDSICDMFGPIETHCFIRPIKAHFNGSISIKLNTKTKDYNIKKQALKELNYNAFIGSKSPSGAHPLALGIDFNFKYYNNKEFIDLNLNEKIKACQEMRLKLEPLLEELGLRMEDNYPGTWIHLDKLPVKYHRFFKPA